MKRILLSVMLIFCITISSTVFAIDSESQTLALNQVFNEYEFTSAVPVTDLYVKDEVYIEFDFKEDISIYGLEAVITYDSEYLEFKEVECSFSDNENSVLIIDTDRENEITYLCSRVGKEEVISQKDLLKLNFIAKKTGNSIVEIKSLKVVYEDLSYEIFDKLDLNTRISIIEKEEKKPNKKGGGSRVGGGVSFSASREDKLKVEENPVTDEKQSAEEEVVLPEKDESSFSDISHVDWAKDAIEKLAQTGAINGYEDNTFRPDDYITRAELTKIIAEVLFKDEINEKEITFNDVMPNAWYYNSVRVCASSGIINGESAEIFAPDRNIMREEFAAMLARCVVAKGISLENQRLNINFADENEISNYAVGYVDMLYTGNILNGDEGYFYPQNNLTRAEAAVGIYNLLSVINFGGQE